MNTLTTIIIVCNFIVLIASLVNDFIVYRSFKKQDEEAKVRIENINKSTHRIQQIIEQQKNIHSFLKSEMSKKDK